MHASSRLAAAVALALLAACGGPPPPTPMAPRGPAPDTTAAPGRDPDLVYEPPVKLLAIDWATVPLATEADANAVWTTIAPTGDDWEAKLDEVPVASARPLAVALLRAGNFTCVQPRPAADCLRPALDVQPPGPTADLADPCLRRLLALWSIAQLEDEDLPGVLPALRQIAAVPPPESQLVAAAIEAVPEEQPALRLELIAIAFRAGQLELANRMAGRLDEAHLIAALKQHHLDGALEVLSAEGHRAVYLHAVTDEALAPRARGQAISELVSSEDRLSPEVRTALLAAVRSKDCLVAAAAARALESRGDARFVPRRPRTGSQAAMMRALCVLASYERLQPSDEGSLLGSFVPAPGLELVKVAYDALSEVDTDGDGDPHTERTLELVPRAELVLPEIEDLIRAFRRCTGTTCATADRDFRFGFKRIGGQLWLARLEVAERPACPSR